MGNNEYPNQHSEICDQKYNDKIKFRKSLVQSDCKFILKYYKNVILNENVGLLLGAMFDSTHMAQAVNWHKIRLKYKDNTCTLSPTLLHFRLTKIK